MKRDDQQDEGVYYDYDRQCWIVEGRVDRCGHPTSMPGCYACAHVGEEVTR